MIEKLTALHMWWFTFIGRLHPWHAMWPLIAGLLILNPGKYATWLGYALVFIGVVFLIFEFMPMFGKKLSDSIFEEMEKLARARQWTEEELKWAGKDKPDAAD